MSGIEVIPAVTKAQQRDFVELQWRLYKDDPYWIPPMRTNLEELAGFRPHPFFEHSQGQSFNAYKAGKCVGRISAYAHWPYVKRMKDRRGYFGFFESEDDPEIANALYDTAHRWLAEKDLMAMRGPINPSLNYELGCLIDGFDTAPCFGITHNPPYHQKLYEGYGMTKAQDLFCFYGHTSMLASTDRKLEFVVIEATRRFDVKVRKLNTKKFNEEIRSFLDIYNQSLVGTWGFTPMSEAEVAHTADSLKYLIVPEMTAVAEINGRIVGVVFGLLDYNPRIKKIDGRLWPFGFFRLLWNKKAIKKVRLISTNVVPEYQKWGLGLVLLYYLVPAVINWGIEEVEFSWVLESNTLSCGSLRRGGAKQSKAFRVFDHGQPTPYVAGQNDGIGDFK